jgi:hypothetical protein
MHSWNQLVRTALLGTERSPLPADGLPESVRARLSDQDDSDQEALFYQAASLTFFYEKAGMHPGKDPLPDLLPAPEETKPYCPTGVVALLRKLLDEPNRRADLLGLCFDRMDALGLVVPPDLLVDVLQVGTLPGFQALGAKIRSVVGKRGAWMQQFNPAWGYLTPADPEDIWENGAPAARRNMLQALRLSDPSRAFALIRNAWDAETNARERRELLKALQINFQPGEVNFLELIFSGLSGKDDKSRQINAEIRTIVVEMLLSQPGSTLYQQMADGLPKYAGGQKSLLGLRSKTVLSLPLSPDALLNPGMMSLMLGFDAASPLPGVSDTGFWFCELVRTLHPGVWEQVFKASWPDILDIFQETARKQPKLPLMQHLGQALSKTGYRPGVLAYTNQYAVDASNYFMLQALTESELEQYVLRQPDQDLPAHLREMLQRSGWQWSKQLSKRVLRLLVADPARYQFPEFTKILGIGVHLHPAVLPELQEIAFQDTKDWQRQVMRNQLIRPLLHIVELKQEILA